MTEEHTTEDTTPVGSKVQPPKPQILLAILIRKQGRVRFSGRELEDIAGQGRIGLKPIDGGGWVLEWEERGSG